MAAIELGEGLRIGVSLVSEADTIHGRRLGFRGGHGSRYGSPAMKVYTLGRYRSPQIVTGKLQQMDLNCHIERCMMFLVSAGIWHLSKKR